MAPIVGKQNVRPVKPFPRNVGFRPGFDTHHVRVGLIKIKDARDVDVASDAKHYTWGHEVHHQSAPSHIGAFSLPLIGGYQ